MAFLPIDPFNPKARIRSLLDEAKPGILHHSNSSSKFNKLSTDYVLWTTGQDEFEHSDVITYRATHRGYSSFFHWVPPPSPTTLVHVFFTSGSGCTERCHCRASSTSYLRRIVHNSIPRQILVKIFMASSFTFDPQSGYLCGNVRRYSVWRVETIRQHSFHVSSSHAELPRHHTRTHISFETAESQSTVVWTCCLGVRFQFFSHTPINN